MGLLSSTLLSASLLTAVILPPTADLRHAAPPLRKSKADALPAGAVARLGAPRFRHTEDLAALVFSPDGRLLAGAQNSGRVLLWEAGSGKHRHRLDAGSGIFDPSGNAFSPDGRRLATLSAQGKGCLWDVATGKPLRRFTAEQGRRYHSPAPMCFSPDGKALAFRQCKGPLGDDRTGDTGDGVTLVEAVTGRPLCHVETATQVSTILFSRDGKSLGITTTDGLIRFHDPGTGKLIRQIRILQAGELCGQTLSPDGKRLAVGGADMLRLLDASTGKEVARLEAEMGRVHLLAFTPDGKTLVSGSDDGKLRLWDPSRKQALAVWDAQTWGARPAAVSPDGRVAAMATGTGVRLWDVARRRERFTDNQGHQARVLSLAFSPDGRRLFSGDSGEFACLWDLKSARQLHRFRAPAGSVAFSPDGRRIASAWGDVPIHWDEPMPQWAIVRDAATGKELHRLHHPGDFRVRQVAFSPDGKEVLTVGSVDGPETANGTRVRMWDLPGGRMLRQADLATREPRGLTLSPDGRLAALGGADQGPFPLAVNRLPDGRRAWTLPDSEPVTPLAFSPDGRLLATAHWNVGDALRGRLKKELRFWEVGTGREAFRLAPPEPVRVLVFSPDGRFFATGPRLRLWDTATLRQVRALGDDSTGASALAFAPGGKQLASGLADGTILIWDVSFLPQPKLSRPDLPRCWADLAGEDAARAHRAVRALAGGERTVAYLRERLRPATAHEVRRLIADLDSDERPKREAASEALAALGDEAEPELQRALAGRPSAEARRRLTALLRRPLVLPAGEVLRAVRAVWVLEMTGTPAAQLLLQKLARGAPQARLTREARAALERLAVSAR